MYDEYGREVPDKTPVALPVGYERPESLQSMIARMIHVAGLRAGKEGRETFEEADDFDLDDDEKLVSPYQFNDMQEEHLNVDPRSRKDSERKSGKGSKEAKKESTQVVENVGKVSEKPGEQAIVAQ